MDIYYWKAKCSDGSYEEESRNRFPTVEACYLSMRNAALNRMKFYTKVEDFWCILPGTTIDYTVKFWLTRIEHTSYAGTYVWQIMMLDENGNGVEVER